MNHTRRLGVAAAALALALSVGACAGKRAPLTGGPLPPAAGGASAPSAPAGAFGTLA